MAVRFAPEGLGDRNRAAPGSTTRIPIRVEPNPGARIAVRSIEVSASDDDGATLRRLTLRRSGTGWVADVRNPASGFVSLRAEVAGSAGGSAGRTIVRAYAVGG